MPSPAKIAGAVLGGALLVILVMALLEVARRKLPGNPDIVARVANVLAPPAA